MVARDLGCNPGSSCLGGSGLWGEEAWQVEEEDQSPPSPGCKKLAWCNKELKTMEEWKVRSPVFQCPRYASCQCPPKGHSSESKHRCLKSSITVNSTATKAKRRDERKDRVSKSRGGAETEKVLSVPSGGGRAAGLVDDFHSGKLPAAEDGACSGKAGEMSSLEPRAL